MSQDTIRELLADLRLSASFLTRVPVGPVADARPGELGRATWAFPVVGALVGAAGGLAFVLADLLGLPAMLSALVAIGVTCLITGGLHEDGLADVADGLGGGATRDDKLAIMRDSRIGTYGVTALVFSVLARAAALGALAEPGLSFAALVGAGALSRAAMVPVMARLPHAREDGLSVHAGCPETTSVVAAAALGAVAVLVSFGFGPALFAILLTAASVAAIAVIAMRQIGGQTGDVLGAVAQVAEISSLLAISASG